MLRDTSLTKSKRAAELIASSRTHRAEADRRHQGIERPAGADREAKAGGRSDEADPSMHRDFVGHVQSVSTHGTGIMLTRDWHKCVPSVESARR
jgi:hypothetical protein